MEPTLPDGCKILVDRTARRPCTNHIYAVQLKDEGLVVKRAGKGPDHTWLLVSDNPTWTDEPWPDDAELVGEVRWMARTLP